MVVASVGLMWLLYVPVWLNHSLLVGVAWFYLASVSSLMLIFNNIIFVSYSSGIVIYHTTDSRVIVVSKR